MEKTVRAAIDARLLEESFQHFENKHLAAFAAEVETARKLYRRWPHLVTSKEMRKDLKAVLHLAESHDIEAVDVMTDKQWREKVREETRESAVYLASRPCVVPPEHEPRSAS